MKCDYCNTDIEEDKMPLENEHGTFCDELCANKFEIPDEEKDDEWEDVEVEDE